MTQPPRLPLPARPDEVPEEPIEGAPAQEAPGFPEPVAYPERRGDDGPDGFEDMPPD